MNLISLLTDFGLRDNFVGVIKAVILGINPDAKIVDISHQICPQNISQAAFLLRSSFKYFPHDTVHLVIVDPGVGSKRKKILVKTKNYFFIAPDNGLLSLVLKDEPLVKVIEITNEKYFLRPVSDTFHGRDIFAPVAAFVSKGKDIEMFGRQIESVETLKLPSLKITGRELTGEIIYIDHFGNLVSNIDKEALDNFVKNKKFKIQINNKSIDKLSHSYSETTHLKPIALIDSFNYLEIALNGASAQDYLRVDKGEKIKIKTGDYLL